MWMYRLYFVYAKLGSEGFVLNENVKIQLVRWGKSYSYLKKNKFDDKAKYEEGCS